MGARGERTLVIPGGGEIALLLTNRALAQAETTIGKPVLVLLRAVQTDEFGVHDLAKLLHAGMVAAWRAAGGRGKQPVLDDAFTVIDELGFRPVATTVVEAFAEVMSFRGDIESPPA